MPSARAAYKRKHISAAPEEGPLKKQGKHSKTWSPASWSEPPGAADCNPCAVLILNQPIKDVDLFVRICRRARYMIAADGGLNRLKDLNLDTGLETEILPNSVCGDLDSVRKDVLKYYVEKGVTVIKKPDQNATDFTKCLQQICTRRDDILQTWNEEHRSPKPTSPLRSHSVDVFVFGGLGGRADQAFSELHHLYKAHEDASLACGDVYLVTPESIIFCLDKGRNIIYTQSSPGVFGENVGIIPIGKPSVITTKGLEWDVEDWPTEFGTQVSTSNHIRTPYVSVLTTERVLFTIELSPAKDSINSAPLASNGHVEVVSGDAEDEWDSLPLAAQVKNLKKDLAALRSQIGLH